MTLKPTALNNFEDVCWIAYPAPALYLVLFFTKYINIFRVILIKNND